MYLQKLIQFLLCFFLKQYTQQNNLIDTIQDIKKQISLCIENFVSTSCMLSKQEVHEIHIQTFKYFPRGQNHQSSKGSQKEEVIIQYVTMDIGRTEYVIVHRSQPLYQQNQVGILRSQQIMLTTFLRRRGPFLLSTSMKISTLKS